MVTQDLTPLNSAPTSLPDTPTESLPSQTSNCQLPNSIAEQADAGMASSATASSNRYGGRILAIDLARGIAILGMFWAHATFIAPTSYWEQILNEIPKGRSALLFAFLAGISLAILSGRNVPYTGTAMQTAKLRIVGRSIALFFITALLYLLEHNIAIILGYYAIWFLIGILFLELRVKTLLISASLLALIGPQVVQLLVWANLALQLGLDSGDATGQLFTTAFITGMYPGLSYLAVVIFGLAVGRMNLRSQLVQLRLIIAGVLIAAVAYGVSWGATHTFAKTPDTEMAYAASGEGIAQTGGMLGEKVSEVPAGFESSYINNLNDPVSLEILKTTREHMLQELNAVEKMINYGTEMSTDDFYYNLSLDTLSNPTSLKTMADDPAQEIIAPELYTFFTSDPHTNTSFEILGALGISLTLLGLLLRAERYVRILLQPLAVLGSMSLTAYVSHIVLLSLFPDTFNNAEVSGFFWLLLALIPPCFILSFWVQKGPLEFLLSKFTNLVARNKKQK